MQAQGALRFSLGRSTTAEQVDTVADALAGIVKKLREVIKPVIRLNVICENTQDPLPGYWANTG